MSDLQELTNELIKDEEFRREYEAIQPELDNARAIMDAQIRAGIVQIQLSERSEAVMDVYKTGSDGNDIHGKPE